MRKDTGLSLCVASAAASLRLLLASVRSMRIKHC